MFFLERLPPPTLGTVRVRERAAYTSPLDVSLQRFEWRRRMGIGRSITDSVFEAEATHDLATVLATRLPGLVVRHGLADGLTFGSNSGGAVEV